MSVGQHTMQHTILLGLGPAVQMAASQIVLVLTAPSHPCGLPGGQDRIPPSAGSRVATRGLGVRQPLEDGLSESGEGLKLGPHTPEPINPAFSQSTFPGTECGVAAPQVGCGEDIDPIWGTTPRGDRLASWPKPAKRRPEAGQPACSVGQHTLSCGVVPHKPIDMGAWVG